MAQEWREYNRSSMQRASCLTHQKMGQQRGEHGLRLRPHAKMHKSAHIARLQMAAGAVGVCVQKTSEAQAMAAPWMERGNFAVAAAWSPNPAKPPFYADLATKDGKADAFVLAQWAANSPAAFAAQYVPALRQMAGIGIDTGDTDFVKADDILIHEQLLKLGVAHDWELYVGDHGNRVTERFGTVVLPFFAKHLKAGK